MESFFVQNFGCRATQADGAALERQFHQRGLSRAASPRDAGIVVLNTCTVTASADQDARAAIRRIHRENPECQIVVTGCYAQRAPDEIAALPGVTQVIGNSHKHQLVEIALPVISATEPQMFVSDIFAHTELLAAPVFDAADGDTVNGHPANERTRPNLKVQDGCDNRCSFCVIPYVRGQSRSLQLGEVIREVRSLVSSGYREVVISGINLGRWGRDLPSESQAPGQRPAFKDKPCSDEPCSDEPRSDEPRSLEFLIRAILRETSLEKLRVSSVEPMDWTDDLIHLMAASPRIAKHAHVPMQSGSDAVLRRMHRKYRPWHYREKLEKIRAAIPSAAIGADVMVGFPGETDVEFAETRLMIESLPLTYLHVFTYSPRPGTPASEMYDQVPIHVARERNRILRDLAAKKKMVFMRGFVGKLLTAITLDSTRIGPEGEFTEALTDNYLQLHLKGRHAPNRWIETRVEQGIDGPLVGVAEPAEQSDSRDLRQ